ERGPIPRCDRPPDRRDPEPRRFVPPRVGTGLGSGSLARDVGEADRSPGGVQGVQQTGEPVRGASGTARWERRETGGVAAQGTRGPPLGVLLAGRRRETEVLPVGGSDLHGVSGNAAGGVRRE